MKIWPTSLTRIAVDDILLLHNNLSLASLIESGRALLVFLKKESMSFKQDKN